MDKNTYFIRDMLFSLLWFLFLAAVNHNTRTPVLSIFPYMIPVVVFAWRYGMAWGFVLAALGTVAAMPAGYMNDHNMDELYKAAFITYLKLTAVVTGIILGKDMRNHRKDDI